MSRLSKSARVEITDEHDRKIVFNFKIDEEESLNMNIDFGEKGAEDVNGVAGFVAEKFLEIVKSLSK